MDLKVTDMRRLLKKVGNKLAGKEDRVSADDLLEISQQVKPSKLGHAAFRCFHCLSIHKTKFVTHKHGTLVTSGGHLFDFYVTLAGSWKTQETWTSHLGRKDHSGKYQLCTPEESEPILNAEKNGFLGFCITQCGKIVSKSRAQLFYHTWNAVFHGLSRLGLHVQASMGLMQKLSNFDSQRKIEVEKTANKIR
jgi:hypothetical protein